MKQTEHLEQCTVFEWARMSVKKYPPLKYMYGTLNGVKLNMGQAVKAKRAGNRRGVPDIVLPFPNKGFHGLYIELKINGNKPSKEQKEYIEYLTIVGYKAEVAYGSVEAIDHITDYMEAI